MAITAGAIGLVHAMADPAAPAAGRITGGPSLPGVNTVNDSLRERDRVLLKRNPIASEFQVPGTLGRSPGAQADGEGSDFRAFLPRAGELLTQPAKTELGAFLTVQSGSGRGKPGFDARVRRHFGSEPGRWTIEARANLTAADRLIEYYAANWEPAAFTAAAGAVYFLQRPTFYQEAIYTHTRSADLHVEHRLGPADTLFAQASWSDYFDDSEINQIEFNTGLGQPRPGQGDAPQKGTTITDGAYQGASGRYYYRTAQTERDIRRLHVGGRHDGGDLTADYAFYHARWENRLAAIGWNFYDGGLDIGYRIDGRDPYFPTLILPAGYDLTGQTARFNDHRNVVVTIRDLDWAGRFDLRRRHVFGGGTLWINGGLLHRYKERHNGWVNDIHFSNPDWPLQFAAVSGSDSPGKVVRDHYVVLPPWIDGAAARARIETGDPRFVSAPARSLIEAAEQIYVAEEAVTGIYAQAMWRRGAWSAEAGLRGERTGTATRGTVIVPVESDAGKGTLVGEVEENGTLYSIREVPAAGRYDSWLPALDLEWRATPVWTLRATAHSRLMRPQYIDIVNYRRVAVTIHKVREGNPRLRPVSIHTLALAVDWRTPRLGELSLGLYSTTSADFFYNAQFFEMINGIPHTVLRIENGDRGALHGVQVQWQRSFEIGRAKVMPTLAYTYSDSEATIPTRPGERLTLPERSRHLWQAGVDWSRGKVGGKAGFSSQSVSLDSVGPAADRDIYRGAVLSLDASLWWRLDERWRATLSALNLTDAPERSYEGDPLRTTRNQYTWTTWRLGVEARF